MTTLEDYNKSLERILYNELWKLWESTNKMVFNIKHDYLCDKQQIKYDKETKTQTYFINGFLGKKYEISIQEVEAEREL